MAAPRTLAAAALATALLGPAAASGQTLDPDSWLPVPAPQGLSSVITAVPVNTYLPDTVVVDRSLGLRYLNLDAARHDVVARDDTRPDGSAPWCGGYREGECPLFWTPLMQGGGSDTQVLGLEDAEPGRSYTFYCSIHTYMVGTIEVVS